jgi:predicted RNA binding protein YcfA (HicA-like mRNA interferase family)
MKVQELIALIKADGWQQVRMSGSHRQFRHPTKPGTAKSVLAQAGLKKQE